MTDTRVTRNVDAAGGWRKRSILALLVLLAACAKGQPVDNPLTQKVSWFSYVNGDDLRAACSPGSPEAYRLVYNARYYEQLRTYEVRGGSGGTGVLTARAQGPADVSSIPLDDVLAPWRWKRAQVSMSAEQMAQFRQALVHSGFFEGPPVGEQLNSPGFYWVAVACIDGRVHFNAWQHPSSRFDALVFPQFLFAKDATQMPVNPPRALTPAQRSVAFRAGRIQGDADPGFLLVVGEAGLGSEGGGGRRPF